MSTTNWDKDFYTCNGQNIPTGPSVNKPRIFGWRETTRQVEQTLSHPHQSNKDSPHQLGENTPPTSQHN